MNIFIIDNFTVSMMFVKLAFEVKQSHNTLMEAQGEEL
jgi:hypothetical protein